MAIRVAIPKEGSDKLYIRVREDAISKAVFITHFDRQPNGQPGPLEASGLVSRKEPVDKWARFHLG